MTFRGDMQANDPNLKKRTIGEPEGVPNGNAANNVNLSKNSSPK